MIIPNFEKYSLALIKDDKIIYSSSEKRLKPLVECVNNYYGKVENCILHDKIIGLAAARVIIYSKFITKIITPTVSKTALVYLTENNIKINANNIIEKILNNDKSYDCPMELRAKKSDNNEKFFNELKDLMRI